MAFLLLAQSGLSSAAGLAPAPLSPSIAQMVARMLERNHYNRHPIDDAASREALKQYLDSYDYNHMILEKADVDAFQLLYADKLDDRIKHGDTQPAFDIFNKFLARLEERVALVKKLAEDKQDFALEESFIPDRHELPWPASPREGDDLWRLRVKHELLQERLNKTKAEEQVKTVVQRYERLLRSYKEFDSNDVLQTFLTALAHTFDPHTDYMAPPQMDNFNISMRLSLVGIGAVLRSEDGYAKIVSLVPGGPADVDKRLKPNDRIEAVGQGDEPLSDVVGMKLDRLVQQIRGEKGTKVRLRVLPADALDPATRLEVALIRDEIKLTDQEAKGAVIEKTVDGKTIKLGLIDLPSFYADMQGSSDSKSTTRDVSRLMSHLKKEGVDGLVLDLRSNGGGSLSEAITLTGLFFKEGPVVQVKDNHGESRILRDTDPGSFYDGPLVVMTSRASASASEILAAALQDYRRAVIVGDKSTFGKGTVQSMQELSRYMPVSFSNAKTGALKITIQKFYRISGGSTQNRGVVPDVRLPSVSDYVDIAESSMPNALPYDESEPVEFQRSDEVTAALAPIQRASVARVAASPEFAYIREDIERYKRRQAEKTISLNEKSRLAEKANDAARIEARKKERTARKAVVPKRTEVTLQLLDGSSPAGTPPAVAPSTAPAVVKDDGTGDKDEDGYDKASPAPDAGLQEGLDILADLISLTPAQGQASAETAAQQRVVR